MPHRSRTLLPVMRACYNMREIIKQLAMLEDHLAQPTKRCVDCCNKHFLTIEGLAEEAVTLCARKDPVAPADAQKIARDIRVFHHTWREGGSPSLIASKLRKLRKGLMKRYATLPLDALPTRDTRRVRTLLRAAAVPS